MPAKEELPMPRKPLPSRLHDMLADQESRLSWEQLEACDLDEWARLTVAQQRELCKRAHQAELDR